MLKPQDILVVIAILALKDENCRQADLAHELKISSSEVNASLKRLVQAKLISPGYQHTGPVVHINALSEFLVHGLKYVFPAQVGQETRGIPTSYAAPVLKGKIAFKDEDIPVWPSPEGKVRGYSLTPLYKSVIHIDNDEIYAYLSLIDAIRSGRARERNLGIKLLEEKLSEHRTT